MSDSAWDNARHSRLVPAGEVQAGDLIAGGNPRHKNFIESESIRTVLDVETLPDKISITYRTAHGAEFTREFAPAVMFYRLSLPAAPAVQELPPLDELPEPLPEDEYKRVHRDADHYGQMAARSLSENDLKRAHYFAKLWKAADAKVTADSEARKLRSARAAADVEASGGDEADALWPYDSYRV